MDTPYALLPPLEDQSQSGVRENIPGLDTQEGSYVHLNNSPEFLGSLKSRRHHKCKCGLSGWQFTPRGLHGHEGVSTEHFQRTPIIDGRCGISTQTCGWEESDVKNCFTGRICPFQSGRAFENSWGKMSSSPGSKHEEP